MSKVLCWNCREEYDGGGKVGASVRITISCPKCRPAVREFIDAYFGRTDRPPVGLGSSHDERSPEAVADAGDVAPDLVSPKAGIKPRKRKPQDLEAEAREADRWRHSAIGWQR